MMLEVVSELSPLPEESVLEEVLRYTEALEIRDISKMVPHVPIPVILVAPRRKLILNDWIRDWNGPRVNGSASILNG